MVLLSAVYVHSSSGYFWAVDNERNTFVAATYPYTLTPRKIPTLFNLIEKRGVPETAIDTWLKQVGFSSENDRRFKNVLRQIGFTDEKGVPTALWRAYRGPGGASKLAEGIREGYRDLFEMFPEAHLASDSELASFIKGHTTFGNTTVNHVVATFRGLVQLADFGEGVPAATASETPGPNGARAERKLEDIGGGADDVVKRAPAPSVTINVNLQLTLPESTDPAVYEALFGALAKHVLQNNA